MLSFVAGLLTHRRRSRSACGSVSGCSTNLLNALKSAVFAPIPSASVRTATKVNPGDLRSWRKANLRSFMSFGSESNDWIHARSAPRRDPRRKESLFEKKGADPEIDSWVESVDVE